MEDKGFLKLSRKFFDNRIWQAARAFSECEAWLDLIQSARFEATPITSCIGCYEVTWTRGQYPASIRFLSKKWSRPEKWVREFLGRLKKENMITIENTQGISVITLTNFDKYNGGTPYGTPNGTPNNLENTDLQAFTAHLAAQVTAQVIEKLEKEGHTNGTNKKKEEENNNKETNANAFAKKGADAPSTPPPNSDFLKFNDWMKKNAPYCSDPKNLKQITEAEFMKLKGKYTGKQIADTIEQLENRKDLRKRYINLYRTLLNWLKNEYG